MLGNKTPLTVVPPGYKPDLDRLPPKEHGGCKGIFVWLLILFIVCGAIIGMIMMVISSKQPQEVASQNNSGLVSVFTDTPAPTATLDYCWFLTPTIEAQPTIYITPDEWQAYGTQTALQTGTPTSTPHPTQAPPKAWCNDVVEATEELLLVASETFTPYQLPSDIPFIEYDDIPTTNITDTPAPTSTAIPVLRPTSTLFPTLIPRVHNQSGQTVQTITERVVVVETKIVIEKVEVETVKQVIITATPQPTNTLEPEITDEPTLPPTETATYVPTSIPTETPTATMTHTNTATFTPTATMTYTATPQPTATLIPTSTLFPTLIYTATEVQSE